MSFKKHLLAVALALTMGLSCMPLLPLTATATESLSTQTVLAITEVCFNPTFKTNSFGLKDSADVLEYVEIVNCSDQAVSLAGMTLQRSNDGYEGKFKTNQMLSVTGDATVLQPGEIAVLAVYSEAAFTVGLRYKTEADRRAFYEFFADFYGCADVLDEAHFLIATGRSDETGEALPDGFNLTNDAEDVVLRVVDEDGQTVGEAAFNAAEWNRNQYSLNFTYRPGADSEHPLTTQPMNMGCTTPGVLRDNQLSTEGMIPAGETTSLKVMEYNICATASEQKKPNGINVSRQDRIKQIDALVKANDPDVIGLCEVNNLWTVSLNSTLTGEDSAYAFYGRSSQGHTYGTEYTATGDSTWDAYNLVLWKKDKYDLIEKGTFWCSSTPDHEGTFSWVGGITGDFARAINWVILKEKATGAELFFLCAHIDAKVDAARDKSAELICAKATELAGGRPIIMVGDWNAKESKEAYRILTSGDFADARYRVPDPTQMTLYGTGNSWGENLNPQNVIAIDHCIITPHNVFVNKATCDLGLLEGYEGLVASDHNAICIDLSLSVVTSETETESESLPEIGPSGDPDTNTETDEPTGSDTVTDSASEDAGDPIESATEPSVDSNEMTSENGSSTGQGCQASLTAVSVVLAAATAAVVLKKKQ